MVLRNDQFMRQMESEFQRSNDASFATESLIGNYLALPALMGFWPISAMGATGQAIDLSGNGLHLTNSGVQFTFASSNPNVSSGFLAPSSTDRFYRADTGAFYSSFTSSYVQTALRGLTAGIWVKFQNLGGADECIIGQWDSGANDRQWMIYSNTNSAILGYFSYDGTNYDYENITAATHGMSNYEWHFLCIQVSPYALDDFVRIWVDDYYEDSAHGQSALHDSSANFGIGHNYSSGSPTNYFEGHVAMAFLCGMNIGTTNIRRLYYRTRPAFQNKSLW